MLYLLSILFIILLICVVWRVACRSYNIPWPHWLAWVLKNPYMLVFCHPEEIAKRVSVSGADKVLDLGCGAGRISIPVAKRLSSQGSLLGVDLQARMVSKALSYADKESVSERCSFEVIDILEQDIRGRFDKIIIVTVLGEIPNIDLVMQKISSMLSEDGVVSVTEVIPDPCYVSKSSLKSLFEKHGFKVSKLYGGPLSYTMNFSKC